MYKKNYTVYTPSISDISAIPFDDLGRQYNELVSSFNQRVAQAKEKYTLERQETYRRQYNAVNEAPYEGDFSEIDIEGYVRAKLPSIDSLGSDRNALFEAFATKYQLKKHAKWLLPQLLSTLASDVALVYKDDQIDIKRLVTDQVRPSPTLTGMWLLCRHPTRSTFLDKQTVGDNKYYCSLVPLFMAAFKKYKNVPYSKWNRADISGVVEPQLATCMLTTEVPKIKVEELLRIRDESLTPKSGAKAGIKGNPSTTYSVYPPAGTEYASMPMLLRIMLFQTWCAHPSNRNEYMILDPLDWDNTPEELITTDPVITHIATPSYTGKLTDLPWDV